MPRFLKRLRPSPAMVIAFVALFVSLSAVAWANHINGAHLRNNSVSSGKITNDGVVSADIKGGGGKTGTIKNRDMNQVLAIAKGFATIDASANPANVRIQNAGGAQTRAGATQVQRLSAGNYRVTFNADLGVGGYANVGSPDQLAAFATARGTSRHVANVFVEAASRNQVRIIVSTRRVDGAEQLQDRDFSVSFYSNVPAP